MKKRWKISTFSFSQLTLGYQTWGAETPKIDMSNYTKSKFCIKKGIKNANRGIPGSICVWWLFMGILYILTLAVTR